MVNEMHGLLFFFFLLNIYQEWGKPTKQQELVYHLGESLSNLRFMDYVPLEHKSKLESSESHRNPTP